MNYTKITAAIAKEKAGRPDATAFAWQMVGTSPNWIGCEVSICDVELLTTGNKSGNPDWSTARREQTLMVTTEEVDAWKAAAATMEGEQ